MNISTVGAPVLDINVLNLKSRLQESDSFQTVPRSCIEETVLEEIIHEETTSNENSNLQHTMSQCSSNNLEVQNTLKDVCYELNISSIEQSNADNYPEQSNIKERSMDDSCDDGYTDRCPADESTSSVESDIYALNFGQWRNLIKNGSLLPPIKSSSQSVQLINTCPIDSIIELFTAAYCFQGSFNNFVFDLTMSKKPYDEIFTILMNYINSQCRETYYRDRMLYCKSRPQIYSQMQ